MKRAGNHPALVLNADHRPLSLFPLSIWPWDRAVFKLFQDKITVVSEYDAVARSPSIEIRLPSVVALKEYIPHRKTPAFTRANVLMRDRYSCGYCGGKFQARELTYDHVIPKSRGGPTRWENIISACHDCNGKKEDRTPAEAKMPLLWRPWVPTSEELHRVGQRFPAGTLPESWHDYLG